MRIFVFLFLLSSVVIALVLFSSVAPSTFSFVGSDDSFNRTEAEIWVVKYTNEERKEKGLEPVERSVAITQVARRQSQNMSEGDYVSHRGANGVSAEGRYESVCEVDESREGKSRISGENVHATSYRKKVKKHYNDESVRPTSEKEVAKFLVEGWMHSEGHRKNILKDDWRLIGVGIVIDENNRVYATQTFCRSVSQK